MAATNLILIRVAIQTIFITIKNLRKFRINSYAVASKADAHIKIISSCYYVEQRDNINN